ncbi:MAG: hypothetical protein HOY79_20755 [Streptomyces sp.]|nr:hypothetical protein [Streptomyces sp.]
MQDITALQAERQRLADRIAEIDALIEAADTSTEYTAIESTVIEFGAERTVWRIARNGKRIPGHEYRTRLTAEDIALGLNSIPGDYSLSYENIGRLGWKFLVRRNGRRITDNANIHRVIKSVQEHVADAPRRAALAAERRAEAEASAIAPTAPIVPSRRCGHCGAPVAAGSGLIASTGLACSTECYDELS